ncbi:MAG: putative metal-binding motif-containing protein [Patescibacteria group bacterium]
MGCLPDVPLEEGSPTPDAEVGCYTDDDRDGYISAACGYGTESPDCDDGDPNVNPGVTEICGDGIDNNCGGMIDEDCPSPAVVDEISLGEEINEGL